MSMSFHLPLVRKVPVFHHSTMNDMIRKYYLATGGEPASIKVPEWAYKELKKSMGLAPAITEDYLYFGIPIQVNDKKVNEMVMSDGIDDSDS